MPWTRVRNCPRCNKDHTEPIQCAPLTNSINTWTHWALCPNTKEPIMFDFGPKPKSMDNYKTIAGWLNVWRHK